jgi:hypothetical protein
MSTRSTAYAPVLTASAVERAEGVDLKACAEARRELATSSLATAKLSELDLGCVDLIDLFRVGSKDQSLH